MRTLKAASMSSKKEIAGWRVSKSVAPYEPNIARPYPYSLAKARHAFQLRSLLRRNARPFSYPPKAYRSQQLRRIVLRSFSPMLPQFWLFQPNKRSSQTTACLPRQTCRISSILEHPARNLPFIARSSPAKASNSKLCPFQYYR